MTNSVEATTASIERSMPPAASESEKTPPAPFGTPIGATLLRNGDCEFRVWAPQRESIELHIVAPRERRVPMKKNDGGYHEAVVANCPEGTRYFFTKVLRRRSKSWTWYIETARSVAHRVERGRGGQTHRVSQ